MLKRFLNVCILSLVVVNSPLLATGFTVASYNCGGLPDHYDYIRAVCMGKLSQERYNAEPETQAKLDRIESLALKILFGSEEERNAAQKEWKDEHYDDLLKKLTAHPDVPDSINHLWHQKSEEIITPYK